MLNQIKKLFLANDVKVNQDNQENVLSEQELQAIVGAGQRWSSRRKKHITVPSVPPTSIGGCGCK